METYDLRNDDEADDLEARMESLKVGESLKIAVENNPSAGYYSKLETEQRDLLKIDGPVYVAPEQEGGVVMLGASGTDEYTLTVIGAGEGQIHFAPYGGHPARRILGADVPTFDFWAHQ